jgi:hypothetical protein
MLPRMSRTYRERLRAWLGSRALPVHVVVLATAVGCVSLGNGLVADDFWHEVFLTHPPGFEGLRQPWWRLFAFFSDEPTVRWFIDDGFGPWWTDPRVHAVLFRPLASATHALDWTLFPRAPALMHAHSLAWAAALVAVAAWVHRRILGPGWASGLATLLYALDPGHGIPVGWLANRNAIMAGVFAISSLGAFDVAARGAAPARTWTIVSAALLALALGSGESGTAGGAFLVAYVATLDERPARARALALAPHAVIVLAWAAAYRLGGYGVAHSGMYIEPLRSPAAFVRAVLVRLPLLLGGEIGGVPGEVYELTSGAAAAAVVTLAAVVTAWAAVAGARLVRADARARFFAVAAVLGTLPSCATFASARLMVVPGFALFGFVAMVAADRGTRAARALAAWAAWARLALSVPLFAGALLLMKGFEQRIESLARGVPGAEEPQPARVVVVNSPDAIFMAFVVAHARLADPPARWRALTLASGRRAVRVRRADERTLVVRVDGGLYRGFSELLVRQPDAPMPAGTRVELAGVSIEVLHAMADGVPDEIAFRFDVPLDDPSLVWRAWHGGDLRPFVLPPPGETTTLPGALPPLL